MCCRLSQLMRSCSQNGKLCTTHSFSSSGSAAITPLLVNDNMEAAELAVAVRKPQQVTVVAKREQ